MSRSPCLVVAAACLLLSFSTVLSAAETVTTAVYARVGNGYQRERLPDGSLKPEYFAIANGGMVSGTSRDQTVDRVTYPEIAALVLPQLARRGYHYAKEAGQASLLLVLHWGNTLPYNDINFKHSVNEAAAAVADLQRIKNGGGAGADLDRAGAELERVIQLVEMQRLVRNSYVAPNARLLGYIGDINDSDDIRRLTGVGDDRYRDLMADVEESRYYVIISAYDFREATEQGKQKLLWVTRVSVRTPGNAFDDSVAAMLKGASKYFGQDSGRLIRGEESKGTVELGDLKFLGEARETDVAKEPEANRK